MYSSTLQLGVIAHVTAGMVDHRCDEKEKYFLTAASLKEPFPCLFESPSLELSVVVPSYNEELRCKLYFQWSLQHQVNNNVTQIVQPQAKHNHLVFP